MVLKWKRLLLHAVMRPKEADGIAKSEDLYQTPPPGAV